MGKYQVSLISLKNSLCQLTMGVAQLFSFSFNSKTPIKNRARSFRWQCIIQFSRTRKCKIIPTLKSNIYSMLTQKSFPTMCLLSLLPFHIMNCVIPPSSVRSSSLCIHVSIHTGVSQIFFSD